LFDVLAHLDLAKVFGNTASRSVVESEHEDTADAIAAAGVAIEISTAGLRKAAGELYPAPGLLRALHRRGVPITLGSDGHVPEDLGRDYDRALSAAHGCGYRRISTFRGRERREVPLG
jgi:histidinol-phosphatase (PHP family)